MGEEGLTLSFAQAQGLGHHSGQATEPHTQLAPVPNSPEQGLEPLRGPRNREGENDAEPTDEGDPVGQQGLEGLGQLCFLGRRKETCTVLLSDREMLAGPRHHSGGSWCSCSFPACSRDGKKPLMSLVASPWRD